MRLFYAAEIPEEQRGELHEIQKKLMESKADVKWVEPQNLHITLRFLGEVAPELLPALEEIGTEVGKLYAKFSVSLKNLGRFSEGGIPRVIWAGIEEGTSSLSMLAQALEDRLEKLNVKKEDIAISSQSLTAHSLANSPASCRLTRKFHSHPFRTHLTLGRVKRSTGAREIIDLMKSIKFSSQAWLLKNFVLKESFLSKTGPTYNTLYSFPLKP